jgi:hypothetical protein
MSVRKSRIFMEDFVFLPVFALFGSIINYGLIPNLNMGPFSVCMCTCYSAPSSYLLRRAPDYRADTASEFHAEALCNYEWRTCPRSLPGDVRWIRTCNPLAARRRTYPLHHRTPHAYTVVHNPHFVGYMRHNYVGRATVCISCLV